MAEYTEHYNLELPANAEHYDIKVANTNNKIIDEKLYEKVEKIPNKSLSTNDFTNGYKQKLDDLKNYDDTQIKKDISNIQKEQTIQNTDISNIKKEQTTQNTDISNIKKEQEAQNTNIEENNSKIVELQTEKAKLETELKEMQEDFYQSSIRGQASGEYIHVEDSSGARCKIGISGNSEQETREGYNQFKTTITSTIVNGVTITKNNDSSVSFEGTTTAGFTVQLVNYDNLEVTKKMYLRNYGTLTNANFIVQLIRSGKTSVEYVPIRPDVTLNVGDIIQKIYVQQQFAGKAVSGTLDILLTDYENKDKGYEQYGAMPSSDYLSEIKAVGDNVNLFDKDNYIKSKLYINKNENKFSEASMGKSFIFDISKYNKLTISKVSTERFGVFASVDYPQKDGVGTYLQDVATKTTSFTYDFTEFNYLVVMYYLTSDTITEQQILDSIKIVEGTDIGEYSKYGQGSVKVTKCNKNLINKNLLTNYQILEDTGKLLSNNTRLITPFIYLKKGTYSLSCNLSRFAYAIYNLDKSFNCFVTWKAFPNQIVLNSDCYIKIEFIINPTGSEQVSIKDITYLQLEKGNTTDCEEHEEQSYIMPVQQPMRSIGDIRDTFVKKDDKWYERHYVQRLILNGTEGWNYDKNNNRFYFAKAGNKGSGYIMSSHYLRGDTTKQNNTCEIWSSAILFRDERFTEREDFKNMIKAKYDEGIPVYVDYVSITPTDIECTEEQSQILEELNNARTYKNVTNITTDSKAILSLDYVKDPEAEHNKMQNEIDEIKQLLSTTQTSALLLDNLQKEVESEVE